MLVNDSYGKILWKSVLIASLSSTMQICYFLIIAVGRPITYLPSCTILDIFHTREKKYF